MIYSMEEAVKNHANIKVFGIGGGGCNAVDRMVEMNLAGIDFLAANTDLQSLSHYRAPTLIQLGAELTRGLGAGGNPKIGREAAREDDERIRSFLEGSDMVFITAGMGGGTGTGGAPVVAQIARELGALTIAVVTKPFRFEGSRRAQIAEAGITELEEFVDTLIVIPNQKLLSAVEHNTPLHDAFKIADEVLSSAVQGISDLITVPGVINLDFADVRTIMTGMGKALMGTGTGTGENKALDAVHRAISSPLLDEMSVKGARGILINITGGRDLTLVELETALAAVQQEAEASANIIFGTVFNENFDDCVKATVIATGFEGAVIREAPVPLDLRRHRKPENPPSGSPMPAPKSPTPPVPDTDRGEIALAEPQYSAPQEAAPDVQTAMPTLVPAPSPAPAPASEDDMDELSGDELSGDEHPELEDTSPGIHPAATEPADPPEDTRRTDPPPEIPKRRARSAMPFDHQTNKELALPKPDRKRPASATPELDFDSPARNMAPAPEKLPPYERQDMNTIPFSSKKKERKHSVTVDTFNYMIPAFLRRKAD